MTSGHNALADQAIPVARVVEMLEGPGESYSFNGRERSYPDIKLVYWAGGNPFHHHQDLNRMVAAWQKPDTILVHEQWWTAAAKHADIVLPATTTLERNDIGHNSKDRYIIAMKKAIEPVGDARSDFDILNALATRLGVSEKFSNGRDEFEWLRHLYDDSRESAAKHGIEMPTFENFWANEHVELPEVTVTEPFLGDFRAGTPLRTPSGKIEIYSETIAGFAYEDCPPHPTWLEPLEWLGSPLASRFPLHMLSNQPGKRLHSQMDLGRTSRDSKIEGREPCLINTEDARARGISAGDIIRVFNDRGACLAGAVLTDDLVRGVIQLSTGAWYDPDTADANALDKHGNPNVLTRDIGTSMLGQGPSAQSVLVEIEKWVGEVPELTAFALPRITARVEGQQ
jgi:biotin/methionine sulfoxide reductase